MKYNIINIMVSSLYSNYYSYVKHAATEHTKSCNNRYITGCTRGVRVVFSVTRMRSSNSARMNKVDFTTEKIGSVHIRGAKQGGGGWGGGRNPPPPEFW